MFCPNCGTDNPAGAFCKECGTPLNPPVETHEESAPQAVQIPVPQPPVPNFAQPVVAPVSPTTPVLNRKDFKKQVASKKYKVNSLICLILAAVLTLAMIGSVLIVRSTSLEKIPLISLVLEIAEAEGEIEDFEVEKRELEYEIIEARAQLERERYELTDDEYALLSEFLAVADKCTEKFSINNIEKAAKIAEKITGNYSLMQKADYSYKSLSNDLDDVNTILDIATAVIIGFMLFALCFTAPGAFCKIKGLVIAGMVISLFYGLILCPIWATAVILALHIAMIVFISIVKKEYKEYTLNPQLYAQKNA